MIWEICAKEEGDFESAEQGGGETHTCPKIPGKSGTEFTAVTLLFWQTGAWGPCQFAEWSLSSREARLSYLEKFYICLVLSRKGKTVQVRSL